MSTRTLNDTFLRSLSPQGKKDLEKLIEKEWLQPPAFYSVVDNWFSNFGVDDKPLAFKVFQNLDYYNYVRFSAGLRQLGERVSRVLVDSQVDRSDVLLLAPSGTADSAHRHSYDITKHWEIAPGQVVPIDQLNVARCRGKIVVAFNDIHGSGNQFLQEFMPKLKMVASEAEEVLLGCIVLCKRAHEQFKENLPEKVISLTGPSLGAEDLFTAAEIERLSEIGQRVYKKHPLGYMGTAALAAFYFQCPNNTLPIVWADGKNNGREKGRPYPWSPLFPYRPKSRMKPAPSKQFRSTRIGLNSSSTDDLLARHRRLYTSGNIEASLAPIEEAYAQTPDDTQVLFFYAKTLSRFLAFSKAKKAIGNYYTGNRKPDTHVLNAEADLEYRLGNYEDSLTLLGKISNKGDYRKWNRTGCCRLMLGRNRQTLLMHGLVAVDALVRACDLAPNHWWVRVNLATAYQVIGNASGANLELRRATSSLKEARQRSPRKSSARYYQLLSLILADDATGLERAMRQDFADFPSGSPEDEKLELAGDFYGNMEMRLRLMHWAAPERIDFYRGQLVKWLQHPGFRFLGG